MATTSNERRQHFRIEVDAPVRFRLIEEKSSKPLTDWLNGATADVGLGGVKIIAPLSKAQVDMLVDKYLIIELSIKLPGMSKSICATASLAYFLRGATNLEATAVTFGVSFVTIDLNAKDALGDFIRRRIESPA